MSFSLLSNTKVHLRIVLTCVILSSCCECCTITWVYVRRPILVKNVLVIFDKEKGWLGLRLATLSGGSLTTQSVQILFIELLSDLSITVRKSSAAAISLNEFICTSLATWASNFAADRVAVVATLTPLARARSIPAAALP